MSHTNEIDLVVKYAGKKGGGNGQLIIDDVELEESRDNRNRHGIGNGETQVIEKGNKTATFSTTAFMNSASAKALKNIDSGKAETQSIYIRDDDVFKGKAGGMVFNKLKVSSSDGGETTVQIDADVLGINWSTQSDD